jgi:zinc transport system substrate-binding protein
MMQGRRNRHRRGAAGRAILAAAGLGAAVLGWRPAAADIAVVASIKPVHSLVASVMAGAGAPALVAGRGDPHGHQLRPSEGRLLADADLVFWVGGRLEGYLVRPLETLAGPARVVTLARAPGVRLLPARAGGVWGPGALNSGTSDPEAWDPHLWLDPNNAKAMVAAIAAALAAADPGRAALYEENARDATARLDELDRALNDRLAPVRAVPFIVFHDAFQYLERRYGLAALGALMVSPDHPPGPRRLAEIRERMAGARCAFREPGQSSRLLDVVTEGSGAAAGVLDPEGVGLAPGPGLYFDLMERLADALRACLAP